MKATDAEINSLKVLQAELQQVHQIIWGLHWNMYGKSFLSVHPFLDTPLEEIDEMVDWVAERIVQVGGLPVTAYEDVVSIAPSKSIDSRAYEVGNAIGGIRLALNELDGTLYKTRAALDKFDTATASQLDAYIGTIEKYLWMVSSEGALEGANNE